MNTSSNAVGGAETATERLQLELEELRSELDRCTTRLHLTEKLLGHVAEAVFVADLDGRIIDVNPAACSLLGYEREELLKMRPWDFATSASWEGILGLTPSKRTLHSDEYGQGPGWWIQHQCDDLGARTQERLGLLLVTGRRFRVEL